ncbi:Txe/YoeB family addiction module toxin [Clostridia bacterium]|nr:Txe/YoeB family addiction module toxin [Clostridia bacterium]
MKKMWFDEAWDDYEYWDEKDKKVVKRIKALLKDIERNGNKVGIGDPEPLKHELSGYYSRKINDEHRLVYCRGDEVLKIISCRFHYKRK